MVQRTPVLAAACLLAVMLAKPAIGQEDNWKPILLQALTAEKKCTVSDMLWVREVPVGNTVGLEGRVRCVDGREFDFTRTRPHMRFELRLCEPVVC